MLLIGVPGAVFFYKSHFKLVPPLLDPLSDGIF